MDLTYELFHRIGDLASANVRRQLVERGLAERVRFRNVGTSDEALEALKKAAGKAAPPVLVVYQPDGTARILEGESQIVSYLEGTNG